MSAKTGGSGSLRCFWIAQYLSRSIFGSNLLTNFYRLKFLSHHKILFHKSHNVSENVLYLKTCLSTYMWLIFPGRSKWPLFSIYNSKHNTVSGEHDQRPGLSEVLQKPSFPPCTEEDYFTVSARLQHSGTWTQWQLAPQAVCSSQLSHCCFTQHSHIQNTTNTGLVSWSKCTTISNMKHRPDADDLLWEDPERHILLSASLL